MTLSRPTLVSLGAALAAAAAIAWWAASTVGEHGLPKVIRVAAPPLQAATSTPGAASHAPPKGPFSTTPPQGAVLGAPDHLTGKPWPVSVTLAWRPVHNALGYVIYRDTQEVGRTTGLSFEDTPLSPGVPHTWTVAALDTANAPGDPSHSITAAAR
jgi:hypothetical protein